MSFKSIRYHKFSIITQHKKCHPVPKSLVKRGTTLIWTSRTSETSFMRQTSLNSWNYKRLTWTNIPHFHTISPVLLWITSHFKSTTWNIRKSYKGHIICPTTSNQRKCKRREWTNNSHVMVSCMKICGWIVFVWPVWFVTNFIWHNLNVLRHGRRSSWIKRFTN